MTDVTIPDLITQVSKNQDEIDYSGGISARREKRRYFHFTKFCKIFLTFNQIQYLVVTSTEDYDESPSFFQEFFVVSQDQHQPMTFHQLLVILIIFAHLNLFNFYFFSNLF